MDSCKYTGYKFSCNGAAPPQQEGVGEVLLEQFFSPLGFYSGK